MKEIVEKVIANPRYQKNIEYGEPRSGHPEGKVKYHIAELEENLEKLSARGMSQVDRHGEILFLQARHVMVYMTDHHMDQCLRGDGITAGHAATA